MFSCRRAEESNVNNISFRNQQETPFLKVVGNGSEAFSDGMECGYLEFRGRSLCLASAAVVPAGSAVSVEYGDALYLGEVVRSTARDGQWIVEIGVEQILSGLNSLLALRKSLMCETPLSAMVGTLAGVGR
jgi:hypothetical protein